MSGKSNAPVIIKRKKVVAADGHHGGAWKVAYADFVTAMMAFFLLMWLLNATTEKQRKGLADYFNPTIPVNRVSGGGDGTFGGDDIMSESTLARNGTGATKAMPTASDRARGETGAIETESDGDGETAEPDPFEEVIEALSARSGESMVSEEIARHIVTRVTDEGLIVELFDVPGVALFAEGSDRPTATLREIVRQVAPVFAMVDNAVAVNAHVRSVPMVVAANPVWTLSGDRADAVRTAMEAAGLPAERIRRVTGFADRVPVAANPTAVRNNRIELILLRAGR